MSEPSARTVVAQVRPSNSAAWLIALGLTTLLLVRLRGSIPAWLALHRKLDEVGVPSEIRNLDAPVLLLASAFLASILLGSGGLRGALSRLGLAAPATPALLLAAFFAAPMFLGAALVGSSPRLSLGLLESAVAAPLSEEVFFRGLLCALLVRCAGTRFWAAALLSGALFGTSHIAWTSLPSIGGLAIALVTGAAGTWYAWLLGRWRWNLWVPIFLHALMNLSWALFQVEGGALGALEANIGRAATIALATTASIRPDWFRLPPTRPKAGSGAAE